MKKLLFILSLLIFFSCSYDKEHREESLDKVREYFPKSKIYQVTSSSGIYWYVLDSNNNLLEVTTAYTQSPIITSIRKLEVQK